MDLLIMMSQIYSNNKTYNERMIIPIIIYNTNININNSNKRNNKNNNNTNNNNKNNKNNDHDNNNDNNNDNSNDNNFRPKKPAKLLNAFRKNDRDICRSGP